LWASWKVKKGGMMVVDFMEVIEKNLIEKKNENEFKKEEMKVQVKVNKNMEMKEKINDKLSKQELRKLKGVIEEKDIKGVKDSRDSRDSRDHDKGIISEINKQKFLLESTFDIESLPKISEGIVNKDIIQNVPEILQNLVPDEFNFKELDQKF
jgi:hypothetical protein